MSESKHVKTYREKHLASGASIIATAEGYIGNVCSRIPRKPRTLLCSIDVSLSSGID